MTADNDSWVTDASERFVHSGVSSGSWSQYVLGWLYLQLDLLLSHNKRCHFTSLADPSWLSDLPDSGEPTPLARNTLPRSKRASRLASPT